MNEKKYCRLRHKTTKDEVQLVADEVDGVLAIQHFYAQAKDGVFRELNRQYCPNGERFEAIWICTITEYQMRDWEVVE